MRLFAFAGIAAVLPLLVWSCTGSDGDTGGLDAAVSDARPKLDAPVKIDAPCAVTVFSPPILPSPHVPVGSTLEYNSNPPSSGPHFPIWAAFKKYDTPVPRGYWVHSMEHGAVVLAYRCGDGGCPDIALGLQAVADAVASDPFCPGDPRVRVIITPDPLLDVPVAAAAWGWTYRAECLDLPSLKAFAQEHYAQGPENTCADGQSTF
jgi:hypothetical protein